MSDERLGDFRKLIQTRFLFTLATAMQAVVLGWRMYDLTHDPLYLGLIGLAEAAPALSLALFSGYVVDRGRPLIIYRRVVLGSLLSGAVLLASQSAAGSVSLRAQVIALFCSSFITGCARSFSQPSLYAAIPKLISRAELTRASAWMTWALQTARITGPALGGLVFGFFGSTVAAAVICVFLLLAVGCVSLVRTKIPAAPSVKAPIVQELRSGITYVLGHPILFPALTLDMFSVLFGGVTALLPIYAAEILHVGTMGLGFLRASPALGATVTSFLLTRLDIRKMAGRWLFFGVTGFGVSILVFGVSRSVPLSILALAASGAFDCVSMVIRASAVQLASPEGMRGRISAVNSIFIGSSNELGEFESGVAAKFLGTVPSVIFGGAVCLLTVAIVAVVSPTLRRMDLHKLEPKA